MLLGHAGAACDLEKDRARKRHSRDSRSSVLGQEQQREGAGEAEAPLGAAGSLPAWAQSAFNNLKHKLLGEIKATHSRGGLNAGLGSRRGGGAGEASCRCFAARLLSREDAFSSNLGQHDPSCVEAVAGQ